MAVINLEPLCAKYGMDAINDPTDLDDKENVVTKALGVLVENGIYAMTVFLISNTKSKKNCEHILQTLAKSLADQDIKLLAKADWSKDEFFELLEAMRGITNDLPKLLLARRVLEATLTFARYQAKAYKRIKE